MWKWIRQSFLKQQNGKAFGARLFFIGSLTVWCTGSAEARDYRPDSVRSEALLRAFRSVTGENRVATVRVGMQDSDTANVLGTVLSADGWILTKASELDKRDGKKIFCRFSDGRQLNAELRATDTKTDLALLKVEAENLPIVQWRTEDDPHVGDWVITTGTKDVPLVVGIVSVKTHRVDPVPVEENHGVLGIGFDTDNGGAEVKRVIRSSAAEKVGIQVGDKIVSINGVEMKSAEEITRSIRSHRPGDVLEITISRGDTTLKLKPELTHPMGEFLTKIANQNQMGGRLSLRRDDFPMVIQHDTVLFPEDCGGPLLDLNGKAVGLNIARAGRTESYALTKKATLEAYERLQAAAKLTPRVMETTGTEKSPENAGKAADK